MVSVGCLRAEEANTTLVVRRIDQDVKEGFVWSVDVVQDREMMNGASLRLPVIETRELRLTKRRWPEEEQDRLEYTGVDFLSVEKP